MTGLEKLGFGVAAGRWLGLRAGEGAVLALLVASAGRWVSMEALMRCRTTGDRQEPMTRAGTGVYVSRIKTALAEVGITPSIVSDRQGRYAIEAGVAADILRDVAAFAEGGAA